MLYIPHMDKKERKMTKIEITEETALALQREKEALSETYEDIITRLLKKKNECQAGRGK